MIKENLIKFGSWDQKSQEKKLALLKDKSKQLTNDLILIKNSNNNWLLIGFLFQNCNKYVEAYYGQLNALVVCLPHP